MSRLKQWRYRLEAAVLEGMERLVPALPRRKVLALAWFLGWIAFLLDSRGRSVAYANLRCALGRGLGAAREREIVLGSYRNFARAMLDLLWAPRLTRENVREWIWTEGIEPVLERMNSEKRGVCFVSIHWGSWEWVTLELAFRGLSLTGVAEPTKNPRVGELLQRRRSHVGIRVLGQELVMVRMLKVALKGGANGFLGDLTVRPNSAATVTNAFGLAHCVPALHAILAQRTRSLIVPVTAEPLEDGRLRITVHPPVPDPVEGEPHSVTASRVWAVFEAIIRARPEYWLWAYKHFRYKPRGAAENEYPFYANESGAFEKVLRKVREEEALFAAQGVHTKMQ